MRKARDVVEVLRERAVDEIEHGIALVRLPVARRKPDVDFALVAEGDGAEDALLADDNGLCRRDRRRRIGLAGAGCGEDERDQGGGISHEFSA